MISVSLLLAATTLCGWQDPGTPDQPAEAKAEAKPTQAPGGETASTKVDVMKLPWRPQWPAVAVGDDGTIHMLWFETVRKGEGHSSLGNLKYATLAKGSSDWSEPIKVNDEPIAVVGPHIALGKDDRPHVCWGSSHPRGFWYTRLDERRHQFEPARDLLNSGAVGLELGPALAVDKKGHVYMAWHEGPFAREDRRQVWFVYSGDDGARFTSAHPINPPSTGACGCCTLAVAAGEDGQVFVAYRAAKDRVGRDMMLLTSKNHGRTFSAETIDPWHYERCPTALTFMAPNAEGHVAVAWETEQNVRFADIQHIDKPVELPSGSPQRLAEMAMNTKGETLVVWFQAETRRPRDPLAWRIYGADGKPTDDHGEFMGSPIAAAARPDGTFLIVH